MKEAVSKRRKAFAADHRSDKDCQAYISAFRRVLSVIAKVEAWQATCCSLSPKSNVNLYNLSFFLLLALLPHLPRFLISPIVSVPESRLRSSPITRDLTFLSPSQRPCVTEPEATFPSSAEPRALRNLTCPFAFPSSPMNSLWLPLTSPCSLPLTHAKLPIPC